MQAGLSCSCMRLVVLRIEQILTPAIAPAERFCAVAQQEPDCISGGLAVLRQGADAGGDVDRQRSLAVHPHGRAGPQQNPSRINVTCPMAYCGS